MFFRLSVGSATSSLGPSLQKAATGFRSPVKLQTHSVHHPKAGAFYACVMAAVRGIPSGMPGS